MVEFVRSLNKLPFIETRFSCCGHMREPAYVLYLSSNKEFIELTRSVDLIVGGIAMLSMECHYTTIKELSEWQFQVIQIGKELWKSQVQTQRQQT